MKTILALLVLAVAARGLAQDSIAVYLDPVEGAPLIGELEAASLAVPAEWPTDAAPQDGWQPVYHRGSFVVHVDVNDMGKELAPKPGSYYYLAPSKNAARLAIATDKDQTDIVSVDTYWVKLQLQTIVVGYIRAAAPVPAALAPTAPSAPAAGGDPTTDLQGILQLNGLLAKNRSGLEYKLTGPDGQTLAFVDVSALPGRLQPKDFLNTAVRVSGSLVPNENGDTLILLAQSLKKAN